MNQTEATELAEAVRDALNRHDHEWLVEVSHPDYEFRSLLASVEGKTYSGPGGMRDYFRDLDQAFSDARWEFVEVAAREQEKLVVVFRFLASGRESGVPIDLLTPMVWSFREGKMWRNDIYPTLDKALRAAVAPG